jgi:ferric-dicitrate binding protein FerR (iron transport regulator)
MKHVSSGNISIKLLIGYIEASLSSSDKAKVMQWIEADPENRKYFELFEETWKNPQDVIALDKESREYDWKVISSAIEKKPDKSGKNIRSVHRWWLRAAGFLLLLSSTAVAYFAGSNSHKPVASVKDHYNEIVVPKGEKSELLLSDGTKIWINAGSSVRFPNVFNSELRDIWLDGEAYFEVASDKSRPFLVHTSELDVKVYGTKFNLKAYSDEDIIETTLVEGIVSLETHGALNTIKDEVFLKPNHKAIYLKKKAQISGIDKLSREIDEPLRPKKIILTRTVQVEPAISWHEGKLIFLDETLESIAMRLERRYDVNIMISNDHIKKVRYTGVLKNVSIEQALKALQLAASFNYSINDNYIIISEKKLRETLD